MNYDIRVGDVYQPFVGGVLSGVDNRVTVYPTVGAEVQLLRDGKLRWLTCKHVATRMRLVERGGVRVGDVYRIGQLRASDVRVVRLQGNEIVVESVYAGGASGRETRMRRVRPREKFIANRVLVERDGKAV